MKRIINMFAICMMFALILMPAAMAAAGDGEGNVKIVKQDGTENSEGIEKIDTSKTSKSTESPDNLDVWGLNDNNMGFANYANLGLIGSIYSSIIPLRNLSLVSIAISAGGAIVAVITVVFLLVIVAAIGGAHPNTKKGWAMISGARSNLLGVMGVGGLALFSILLLFFGLAVFAKIGLTLAV